MYSRTRTARRIQNVCPVLKEFSRKLHNLIAEALLLFPAVRRPSSWPAEAAYQNLVHGAVLQTGPRVLSLSLLPVREELRDGLPRCL